MKIVNIMVSFVLYEFGDLIYDFAYFDLCLENVQ